jgi:hypothetical protein
MIPVFSNNHSELSGAPASGIARPVQAKQWFTNSIAAGPMTANYGRWVEIAMHVREGLIEFDADFAEFPNSD